MKGIPIKSRLLLPLMIVILLMVLGSSCLPNNSSPLISSLKAEEVYIIAPDKIKIECVANDPDGDTLSYTWTATGGSFSGTGPITSWTPPNNSGRYEITVMVTDDNGNQATMSLDVEVRENQPPLIQSLIADPTWVSRGKDTTVECIASDSEGYELIYSWSASGGTISGEGSSITWTGPTECGDYIITVTVEDHKGETATQELKITVNPG
ncbi:Ig-like domain-containing protein [Chloroflexota bacterium]